jgi:uncharacterized membrane protein
LLLLGALLPALLTARDVWVAASPSGTEWSAGRHASAQGFLLVVMVMMAARLLPVYASDAAAHRLRLEVAVDLLLVGALLRVGAELLGGYAGVAGPLTALGGAASVGGFVIFAVGLLGAVGRATVPPAGGPLAPAARLGKSDRPEEPDST